MPRSHRTSRAAQASHGVPASHAASVTHTEPAPHAARLATLAAAVAATAVAAALAGCGSSTKTVSAAGAPPTAPKTPATQTQPAQTQPTSSTTTPTTPTATGTTSGPQTTGTATRSAPTPAFAQQEQEKAASGRGLPGALAVVRAHGYTTKDTSVYHADQTLRVLVGTGAGSSDGHEQQAFFFVGDRYIGTDSTHASGAIAVVAQGDTEVTLAYALYRPHDSRCCPSGGQARVRFALDNGRLAAQDPIPPVSSATGSSRQ